MNLLLNELKKRVFPVIPSVIRLGVIVSAAIVAAVVSVQAASVSFSDNFTPAASPEWNNYAGNWTASNGQYYAQVPNNAPSTYTGLPYELTNFSLTVTVNNLGDSGTSARTSPVAGLIVSKVFPETLSTHLLSIRILVSRIPPRVN